MRNLNRNITRNKKTTSIFDKRRTSEIESSPMAVSSLIKKNGFESL